MLCSIGATSSFAQVSVGALPNTYTQDFNTLSNTIASTTLPPGWILVESGTGSNTSYSVTTGTSTAADTYSAGASSSTDRALGSLRSNALGSTIGASFTNNSGSTITDLQISYTGEQWRTGTTQAITDRMDFQYSLNATDLVTGTFTDVDQLDFSSPLVSAPVGAKDGNLSANRTSITYTISGLSISPGSTFYIRWVDFNVTNTDDILAIDDLSITFTGGVATTIATSAISGSPFNTTCSAGASVTVPFTSSGTFNAGNVYTAQLSNASGSFASPVSIGTLSSTALSGNINATIPAGTAAGTGYRIRVVSSSPSVTGTNNGSDLTVTYTCSVTTDPVSGSPFNLTCSSGASVNVPFTTSSAFNGSNTFTAQLSDASGSFASPLAIGTLAGNATSGTITATIPTTVTPGSGYRIRVVGSDPAIIGTDNGSNLTITYTCSITTGAISGSPFNISCSAGTAVSVPFTTSSAFYGGNTYTAQLSDASGSFTSPVTIGTLSSSATSGTISATIPSSTSPGTGYRIRVIGSNPSITGSNNGVNLTVTYSCAALVINEIYVNADVNDGSPNPNLGEWVELYNGTGAAIDLSCYSICDGDFCVTFPSGSTIAAGGYFTIGSAAGAGCAGCDFPGATFNIDWGTCGCTSGTTVGTFTNGNEQLILFNQSGAIIDAIIWGGGQDLPATMNTANTGGCAPVSVTLPTSAGGAYENIGASADKQSSERAVDGSFTWQLTSSPTLGGTNNPPLPVELISFKGKATPGGNLLEWSTASEINNQGFVVERSTDGKHFQPLAFIPGNGTINSRHDYDYLDDKIGWDQYKSYYRLVQRDFDGKSEVSNIITVQTSTDRSLTIIQQDEKISVDLGKKAESVTYVRLFSVTGQTIGSAMIPEGSSTAFIGVAGHAGVYFISVEGGSYQSAGKVFLK